jgi:hypothetical protein
VTLSAFSLLSFAGRIAGIASRLPLARLPGLILHAFERASIEPALRDSKLTEDVGPRVRIPFAPAASQVRTCLSREFAFLRREAAVFRGCAGRGERRVGRDAQDTATSGLRAAISLSGYIPVPHRRWAIFEFGSGSGKTEHDPLIVPGKRQTGVREKLLRREIVRLPPIEDRLGDIRREIAEADETSEIGPADTFPLGEYSKGDAFAVGECR